MVAASVVDDANSVIKTVMVLALPGFVITSTNSRALRYPTDQGQT